MSLQNRSPIRVSDFPVPVYVPRVPTYPTAKAYQDSSQQRIQTEMDTPVASTNLAESPSNLEAQPSNDVCDLFNRSHEPTLEVPACLQPPITTRVWDIKFHVVNMEQALDYLEQVIRSKVPSYAITANLNYAMLCAKHPRLAAFTEKSTLTLCDGMPVLWRSRLNAVKLPERVAGSDLIFRLTERCAKKKFRVYFYGASEGIAEKAANSLRKLYPSLIIAGVQCPPFRACTPEEVRDQIESIKQAKPDLLYIALGQPKGEYWIEDHLEELGVPLTIQLGASFDFIAGNSARAPKIMQRVGLEWLHRTLLDPMRLAPRYFSNLMFLLKTVRRELIEKLS